MPREAGGRAESREQEAVPAGGVAAEYLGTCTASPSHLSPGTKRVSRGISFISARNRFRQQIQLPFIRTGIPLIKTGFHGYCFFKANPSYRY